MTHAKFTAAHRAGRARMVVDPLQARRFVATRMMLAWILLPAFGTAVALALAGRWVVAGTVLAVTIALRWLVGFSSAGYVAQRAMADAGFFSAALTAGAIRIVRD